MGAGRDKARWVLNVNVCCEAGEKATVLKMRLSLKIPTERQKTLKAGAGSHFLASLGKNHLSAHSNSSGPRENYAAPPLGSVFRL